MNNKQLNKIAGEMDYSPMAALAADRLLAHVANGGWLGASADHYAFGIVVDGKVVKSGFDCFSDQDRRDAVSLALAVNPSLWDDADENFRRDSEGEPGDWIPARIRGPGEADVPYDGDVWVTRGASPSEAIKEFEKEGNTFFFWL